MPVDTFSHMFRVTAPPSVVYAHLMDPQSYVGLAPLVVEVRDVRGPSYVAVERFRFGPIVWDNKIKVTTTGTPESRVTSAVVSPGWVRLTSVTDLTPDGTGATVTETVTLHTPFFLRSFALGKAREAQAGRAVELTRRMARL